MKNGRRVVQKYGLQFYESECDVLNADLFKEDEITDSVLKHIVNNACRKVFTDGERSVVCLSVSILYADGDYEASNGCYRKIGFRQVGSLPNVSQ